MSNNDINIIIDKVQELTELISDHEITKKYKETLNNLNKDSDALNIHSRLIELGKKLNERGHKGEPVNAEISAENSLLKEQLENNPKLTKFLQAQKVYLNLVKFIHEKIKNPD